MLGVVVFTLMLICKKNLELHPFAKKYRKFRKIYLVLMTLSILALFIVMAIMNTDWISDASFYDSVKYE